MEQCPYCAKGIPMPEGRENLTEEELRRWQDIERRLVEKGSVSKEEREFYFSKLDVAQGALLNRKLT
jgi:hypothetical protein